MQVVFQQADLDTCLTAVILGVTERDELSVTTGEASAADLANPSVLCIEAGGSGRTDIGNYDHYGIDAPIESACVQAFASVVEPSEHLRRLVAYVATVDRGRLGNPPLVTEHVMTLSSVFLGIGVDELVKEFEAQHDDDNAIIAKALADRLAEAFAENLHAQARHDWGYGKHENFTPDELAAEKYRAAAAPRSTTQPVPTTRRRRRGSNSWTPPPWASR